MGSTFYHDNTFKPDFPFEFMCYEINVLNVGLIGNKDGIKVSDSYSGAVFGGRAVK